MYPGGKGAAGHFRGRVKGAHMGLIKECGWEGIRVESLIHCVVDLYVLYQTLFSGWLNYEAGHLHLCLFALACEISTGHFWYYMFNDFHFSETQNISCYQAIIDCDFVEVPKPKHMFVFIWL